MSVRMRIIGTSEGPTAFDGQYVMEYDPSRPGVDPEGREMVAHIVTTPDPEKARIFETLEEALALWKQSHGIREDGRPNRPLTAFTVTFE